jgi:hypothetical protein
MLVIQSFIKPHARYGAGLHLMRATAGQARASKICPGFHWPRAPGGWWRMYFICACLALAPSLYYEGKIEYLFRQKLAHK